MRNIFMIFSIFAFTASFTLIEISEAEARNGRRGAFAAGAVAGALLGGVVGSTTAKARADRQYNANAAQERHIAYCSGKYKSYQPRSNTWVSHSGKVRYCTSPYLN